MQINKESVSTLEGLYVGTADGGGALLAVEAVSLPAGEGEGEPAGGG